MIWMFAAAAAHAGGDVSATVVVKPGECVQVTTDSFLVPENRLRSLTSLAEQAQQIPVLQKSLLDAAHSLDACSAELSDAQAAESTGAEALRRADATLLTMKRERNAALVGSGVLVLASGAALLGAFVGR